MDEAWIAALREKSHSIETAAAAAGSSAGSLALLSLFPRSGEHVRHGTAPNWASVKEDSLDLAQRASTWVKENPYQACAIAVGTVGVFSVIRAVRRRRRKKSASRPRSTERYLAKKSSRTAVEKKPSAVSVATTTGKTLVVGSFDEYVARSNKVFNSTADILASGFEKAPKDRHPSRTTKETFKACVEIAGLQSIEAGLSKLKLKLIDGGQISTDMLDSPDEKAAFALLSQILEDPDLLESRSELAKLSRWFATFFPQSSGSSSSPSPDVSSPKELTSPFSGNLGSTQATCDEMEEMVLDDRRCFVDPDEELSTMRSITCASSRLKRSSSIDVPEGATDSTEMSAEFYGKGRISGGEASTGVCQLLNDESSKKGETCDEKLDEATEGAKAREEVSIPVSPNNGPSGDTIDAQPFKEKMPEQCMDLTCDANESKAAPNAGTGIGQIQESGDLGETNLDAANVKECSSSGSVTVADDVSCHIVTDVGDEPDDCIPEAGLAKPWTSSVALRDVLDERTRDAFIVADCGSDQEDAQKRRIRCNSEPPTSHRPSTIARMTRKLGRRSAVYHRQIPAKQPKVSRRRRHGGFFCALRTKYAEDSSSDDSSMTISHHRRRGIGLAKIVSLPVCDLSSWLSRKKGPKKRLSLTASCCISLTSCSSLAGPKTAGTCKTLYRMKPRPSMCFSDGASSMAPSFASESCEDAFSNGMHGEGVRCKETHQQKRLYYEDNYSDDESYENDDTGRSIPKITELNDLGASPSLEMACIADIGSYRQRGGRHKGGHGATTGQPFPPIWRAYHQSDVKLGFVHKTASDSRLHNAPNSSFESSFRSSRGTLSTLTTSDQTDECDQGEVQKNPQILVVSSSEETDLGKNLIRGAEKEPDFVAAYDSKGLSFCLPIGCSQAPSSSTDESSSRLPLQSSWYSTSSDTAMHTSRDVSEDIASFETAVVHPFFSDEEGIAQDQQKLQMNGESDVHQKLKANALKHKSPLSLVLRGLVSPFLTDSDKTIIESDEDEGDHLEAIHIYSDCHGKPWKGNEDFKTCAWEKAQLASSHQTTSSEVNEGMKPRRSSAGADNERFDIQRISSAKQRRRRPATCHCPTPPIVKDEEPAECYLGRSDSGDGGMAAPEVTIMAFRCIIKCCEWIDATRVQSGPLVSEKLDDLEQVSRNAFLMADWSNPFKGCESYLISVVTFLCDPPPFETRQDGFGELTKHETSWLRNFGWKGREFKACRFCSFQTFVTGEVLLSMVKINAWEGGMYPARDLTNGKYRYRLEDWVESNFMESGLSFKCPRQRGSFCCDTHEFRHVFKVEKSPTVAVFSVQKTDSNYFEFPDSMKVPEVIGFRSPRKVGYRLLAFMFEWKSGDRKPQAVMCCKRGTYAPMNINSSGWHCRSNNEEWEINPEDSPKNWLATPEITKIFLFYGSKPPTREFLASFYERY